MLTVPGQPGDQEGLGHRNEQSLWLEQVAFSICTAWKAFIESQQLIVPTVPEKLAESNSTQVSAHERPIMKTCNTTS